MFTKILYDLDKRKDCSMKQLLILAALCAAFFMNPAMASKPTPSEGQYALFPGVCLSNTVMVDIVKMLSEGKDEAANAKMLDMMKRKICVLFTKASPFHLIEKVAQFDKGKTMFQVWRIYGGGNQAFGFLSTEQKDSI